MVASSRSSEPGTSKSSLQTASLPILSLPLPPSPCAVVSQRHASPPSRLHDGRSRTCSTPGLASAAAQTDAYLVRVFCCGIQGEGAVNVLVDVYIHLWGRIVSLLSHDGFHFFFPRCHSPCTCWKGMRRPCQRRRLRGARNISPYCNYSQ